MTEHWITKTEMFETIEEMSKRMYELISMPAKYKDVQPRTRENDKVLKHHVSYSEKIN